MKTDPQMAEIARILAAAVKRQAGCYRLMVTAASLEEAFVRSDLDSHAGFLTVPYRRYEVERAVVAPKLFDDILPVCADLVLAAVREGGGNILVFLPGMDEILRVRKLILDNMVRQYPNIHVRVLHSDTLGADEKAGRRGA